MMTRLAQEYFIASAQKYPQKIAVNFQNQNITYQELERYSNQLAHLLKSIGVRRNDRVVFYVEKSIDSIKSILGILKADGCYVPLDPKSPLPRLKQIVEDCQPAVIICNQGTLNNTKALIREVTMVDEQTETYRHPKIVVLSAEEMMEDGRYNDVEDQPYAEDRLYHEKEIRQQSAETPIFHNTGNDLAYIFYTSGSTGKPKGVMISHANIISFIQWAVERFAITAQDRLSNHAPMHFDLSTFDIYCTFKTGASLYIVPHELNLFPEKVVQFIEEKELTIWLSVPSILVYLAKMGVLRPERIPTVRLIFSTGEVFPTPYVIQWRQLFPDKTIINMFGPTETTVECTYYIIDQIPADAHKNIPMGKGCDHLEVFALDEQNKPIQAGEVGELYVRGPSVSPGYWNNPEKTKLAFVPNPLFPFLNDKVYRTGDLVELTETGDYLFRGRKDNQIKFMGYRIELGEIEAALYSFPYLREAAVVFNAADEKSEIMAFLSLRQEIEIEKIRLDLAGLVPKYMIPKTVIILNELPRTSTGKVDKMALKQKYAANYHGN